MGYEFLSRNDRMEVLAILDDLFLKKKKDDLEDDLLAANLRKVWRNTWTAQLEKIVEALGDMPIETHAGVLEEIRAALLKRLGAEFAESEPVQKAVDRAVRKAYSAAKARWLDGEITADAEKIALDSRAVQCIRDTACYWIGEFYGAQVQPEVGKALNEALVLGLDSAALAARLKDQVGQILGNSHYTYWDVAASSMLVRARAFGNVFGMEEAQITEYEIFAMLDEGTCRICREMDGRRFKVAEAAKTCRRVLEMTDPEKVKAALPWMSAPPIGVSSKKLTEGGKMLPPFHGRCRCDIVMHETKTEKTDDDVKKEIRDGFPKNKQKDIVVLEVNQDERIASIKANSLYIRGLPNWKYDLIDKDKDGIIKERRFFDNLGRVETEIHLSNHGSPSKHDKPHVHRSIYSSAKEMARHTEALDKVLISWEKDVVANIPEDKLDKDDDWIWKSVISMLSKAKKILKKL